MTTDNQDKVILALNQNDLKLAISILNEEKNKEITQLKKEIDILKMEINNLNVTNNNNKKRKDSKILKNVSNVLVQLLKNKKFEEFVKIIKENSFAADEYLGGEVNITI